MPDKQWIASEADGTKAVQYLQACGPSPIQVSEADALEIWNSLAPHQQQITMSQYQRHSGDTSMMWRRPITFVGPKAKHGTND